MTVSLAAVVYGSDQDCDALLAAFAAARLGEGFRVVGLVQVNGADMTCEGMEMALKDLATGRQVNICQDLGAGSVGVCRLDATGLAEAAGLLRAALVTPADLVVVNKFGRMEADGAGLVGEIGEAAGSGRPLIIGVPRRLVEAWDAFAGGMDVKLACDEQALTDWWRDVSPRRIAAE